MKGVKSQQRVSLLPRWRTVAPAVMINKSKSLTSLDNIPQHHHLLGARRLDAKAERVPILFGFLNPLRRLTLQLISF